MNQGDLWLADMNPPRLSKPGKLRPVLIVQASDLDALGKQSVTVVPLTSQLLPPNRLRLRVSRGGDSGLSQDSDILADEIHTLHRSLLKNRLGAVPTATLDAVLEGILFVLGLPK